MITSKEIVQEIKTAIQMFGEYTYHDKGAYEVMDLSGIKKRMDDMTAEQIIQVLTEVQLAKVDSQIFIRDMVSCFDSDEDERANQLFESQIFQENY